MEPLIQYHQLWLAVRFQTESILPDVNGGANITGIRGGTSPMTGELIKSEKKNEAKTFQIWGTQHFLGKIHLRSEFAMLPKFTWESLKEWINKKSFCIFIIFFIQFLECLGYILIQIQNFHLSIRDIKTNEQTKNRYLIKSIFYLFSVQTRKICWERNENNGKIRHFI